MGRDIEALTLALKMGNVVPKSLAGELLKSLATPPPPAPLTPLPAVQKK